jgi:hypothetical protein
VEIQLWPQKKPILEEVYVRKRLSDFTSILTKQHALYGVEGINLSLTNNSNVDMPKKCVLNEYRKLLVLKL